MLSICSIHSSILYINSLSSVSSSISTEIVRHEYASWRYHVRSHILHPYEGISVICMIRSPKENVLSVIEDHLLESISSTEWKIGDEESDFSYVTEKYNHFLSNLAEEDTKDIHALFAIQRGIHIMVSTVGGMYVLQREPDGTISNIHKDTLSCNHFELISSGEIGMDDTLFFLSSDLSHIIWDEFYDEVAVLEKEKFITITEEIFSRESRETIHIIRISNQYTREKKEIKRWSSQIHVIRMGITDVFSRLSENIHWRDILFSIEKIFQKRNTLFTVLFLVVWIVIFFLLLSTIISALFNVTNTSSYDAKNQIIKAKTIIDETQKLSSNREAFESSIKQAIDILAELKKKQLYIKDTTELSARIEAMKKEIYDIQSVDLRNRKSIIAFNPTDISPIWVFEHEKKLTLIWKQWAITAYAPWEPLPKMTVYPPWEEVIDHTVTEDGNFLLLTKNNRILASRKNAEITYVNVTGQESWEISDIISTFNGNIYLTNTKEWQTYKHKPGMNGFSQKTPVFSTLIPGIKEVGVDGWFYVLTDTQRVLRIMNLKGYTQSGITLNKVPWEYSVGKNNKNVSLILQNNLRYIYVLDGNRIWIFEPDSKRFQDIHSWNYVAQMELETTEEVRNIAVPRDGALYIVTNNGVYDINFEFVDNNIILRS